MKIRYLLAASAALVISAGSAQAADIIYQEPMPMVPVFSWQGFYVGGQIGSSWARGKVRGHGFGVDPVDKRFSSNANGFVGGIYAGYNFDAGNNVILGIETDWAWNDMDDKSGYFTEDGTHYYESKIKQKWVGATRIRAGYAMDRWLPYIAGGVAYGKVNSHLLDRTLGAGGDLDIATLNKTLTGWTIGVGTDYAVTDNVLVRLEYRFTDLGNKSFGDRDNLWGRGKYQAHDVRVGVAYKF